MANVIKARIRASYYTSTHAKKVQMQKPNQNEKRIRHEKILTIVTRKSPLALWAAHFVKNQLTVFFSESRDHYLWRDDRRGYSI